MIASADTSLKAYTEQKELINELCTQYQASRFARFMMWCERQCRFRANKPFSFTWVEEAGDPVGPPLEVHHLTLHDMMEHAASGRLTDEILLRGLRANAIQYVRFERIDDFSGKTTIQPRWI
ncbi:MAG: hypothetical protein KBE09_00955 [Candidatus Pacebacteria bacterium]|nr:hypothetical protein [Candidatus Paceibacterota bacterium]